MKPRYLTKSRFKLGLDCPTKLFYTKKKEYANLKNEDTFLESLAQGGFQVEELARMQYPDGILIENNDGDLELLVEQTAELLKNDHVVLYEAAFKFENLYILSDIVVKNGINIELIEVKAKSFDPANPQFTSPKKGLIDSTWRPYLYDLAFQKHVIQLCHPNWNVKAFLMLADKTKSSSVDGLNQMFRITKKAGIRTGIIKPEGLSLADTGDSVLSVAAMDEILEIIYSGKDKKHGLTFFELIKTFSEHYEQDKKMELGIGWHCKKCEFRKGKDANPLLKSGFEECWKKQMGWSDSQFNKPTSFDVWNFPGGKKLLESDERRIFMDELRSEDFGDKSIPLKISSSQRKWIQVEKTVAGDNTPHVEREGLIEEMKSWKFPLNFIDFETSGVALPFSKGRKPNESVAFQFSHHILHEDGRIEHAGEFISHRPGEFPNFLFVRALMNSLASNDGSVFRYHNHENSILNAILRQLAASEESDKDDLIGFIKSIAQPTGKVADKWDIPERHMIDLYQVILKYYYHPKMKGGNGLKFVLPAIFESSTVLRNKYTKSLGELAVSSINFPDTHVWLGFDDTGNVISPYKTLPAVFEGWEDEEIEATVSELDDIKDGGGALTAYAKLQYEVMRDEEREKIVSGLLKYCELDTLAMVMVYEALKEEVDKTP